MIYSLKCTNGIVNVYDDRVEISRKTAFGIASQNIRGDRTIFYTDMSGVEYKKPSMIANGYMKFILPGANDNNSAVSIVGTTTLESLSDPNTLILRAFKKSVPKESEEIYKYVMQRISEVKSTAPAAAASSADEIGKYKALLDSGAITQDEYEAKKKQLLGL